MNNQEAKRDEGKAKISLVPPQIIYDIAEVREYGNRKYGDPDNWKTVEPERYIDALGRHFIAMLADPLSKDPESGIEHYKHCACNLAFLCEMYKAVADIKEIDLAIGRLEQNSVEMKNEFYSVVCLNCEGEDAHKRWRCPKCGKLVERYRVPKSLAMYAGGCKEKYYCDDCEEFFEIVYPCKKYHEWKDAMEKTECDWEEVLE